MDESVKLSDMFISGRAELLKLVLIMQDGNAGFNEVYGKSGKI